MQLNLRQIMNEMNKKIEKVILHIIFIDLKYSIVVHLNW